MPRKKYPPYKRVNIYLNAPQLKTKDEIANYSAFVQIATDNAAQIMAWAILRKVDPKKYHPTAKLEDVIDEFNEKFPKDPLFNKTKEKTWPKNSVKPPEPW